MDCLLEGRPVSLRFDKLAVRCTRGLCEPISVDETSSSVVVIWSGSSDIVTAITIRSDMASVSDWKVTQKFTERRNACYTENNILTHVDPH